jgi:hypothetical protein
VTAELSALDEVLERSFHARLVVVHTTRSVVVELAHSGERERLRTVMAVKSLSGMACTCMGDIRFELLDARWERLDVVLLHHGITLARAGWDSHAVLADGRALQGWLSEHGLPVAKPRAEEPDLSWREVADRLLNV